ncbi:peroxiredoxin [Acidithiobacillus sp. IBUN Pt1247-S3]|uniref:peroxiredoxin n=1 Tax=Acidithiobacillus sp. IBUN Pt1247-S3 TaxID=3166642 RepID=UPI0034E46931
MPESLEIGQTAPEFFAKNQRDESITLSSLRGKAVVLYFYPKDDTPGCTTEGQEFAAHYKQFQEAGAEILGVSRDSVASHLKFACKYEFPFSLLSDPDETLCHAYDVIKEKNNYGKVYLGIERSTFVVDREGKLAYIERKVKAAGHAENILAIVQKLA